MSVNGQSIMQTSDLAIGYSKSGEGALYKNLNLSLREGSLTCLMGPNGSGKSTLLKTLTGLLPSLQGQVFYHDDPDVIKNSRKRAKTFSIVLTGSPQMGLIRVRELVALGRHPYTGWAGNFDREDIRFINWALEAVHANELADRMTHTLSDGERQRVMVARALAQNTPIIYLDEPTAFLDLSHKIELMYILRKLSQECGLTLLISTHDLELSLQYADFLWLLESENHCQCGAPEDLLLSGAIERIFGNKELVFNRERGVFHAQSHFKRFAAISGDPIGRRWTQNALEKTGIGVSNEQDCTLRIHVKQGANQHFYWRMESRGNSQECDSIETLVTKIEGSTP